MRDAEGGSALHWAALRGHSAAIAALIGSGADKLATTSCVTAASRRCTAPRRRATTPASLAAAADPAEARAIATISRGSHVSECVIARPTVFAFGSAKKEN